MPQPIQPQLQQLAPEEQAVIKAIHDNWRAAGADKTGAPVDVDSNKDMMDYRKAVEGEFDANGKMVKPPRIAPVPGVDLKSPLQIPEVEEQVIEPVKEPTSKLAQNVKDVAGGVYEGGLEFAHSLANPVNVVSGLETTGRIAGKIFLPSDKPANKPSDLFRSLFGGVKEAAEETVVKPWNIKDTAGFVNAIGQKVSGETSNVPFTELVQQNQQYFNSPEMEDRSPLEQNVARGTEGALALASLIRGVAPTAIGAAGGVVKQIPKVGGALEKIAATKAVEALKPIGAYFNKVAQQKGRVERIGQTMIKEGVLSGNTPPSWKTMQSRIKESLDENGKIIGDYVKRADTAVERDGAIRAVSREQIASEVENNIIGPLKEINAQGPAKEVEAWVKGLREQGGQDMSFKRAQEMKGFVGKEKARYKQAGDDTSRAAFDEVYGILNKHITDGIETALVKASPETNIAEFIKAKEAYRDLSDAKKFIDMTVARDSKNRMFTLTDYISGSIGATSGGGFIPAVLTMGVNKVLRTRGNQLLSKAASKAASGPSLADVLATTGGVSGIQNKGEQ
jgi:hypothetical protein